MLSQKGHEAEQSKLFLSMHGQDTKEELTTKELNKLVCVEHIKTYTDVYLRLRSQQSVHLLSDPSPSATCLASGLRLLVLKVMQRQLSSQNPCTSVHTLHSSDPSVIINLFHHNLAAWIFSLDLVESSQPQLTGHPTNNFIPACLPALARAICSRIRFSQNHHPGGLLLPPMTMLAKEVVRYWAHCSPEWLWMGWFVLEGTLCPAFKLPG